MTDISFVTDTMRYVVKNADAKRYR